MSLFRKEAVAHQIQRLTELSTLLPLFQGTQPIKFTLMSYAQAEFYKLPIMHFLIIFNMGTQPAKMTHNAFE